jgi:hypothetical protein
LPQDAVFCGACGWRVAATQSAAPESAVPVQEAAVTVQEAKESAPTRAPAVESQAESVDAPAASGKREAVLPVDVPQDDPSLQGMPAVSVKASMGNIISAGLGWAAAWCAGWVPLGLFMGFFWQENRIRHAAFFDRYGYDPGWGYTLPGATVGFGLAGLLGGFVAGVILCKAVPRACMGGGMRALIVTLLWIVGWAVAIGGPAMEFLSGYDVSDDMLLLLSFGAALVVSLLATQVAMHSRAEPPSKRSRLVVTLGWIGAAIMACIFTAAFIGL